MASKVTGCQESIPPIHTNYIQQPQPQIISTVPATTIVVGSTYRGAYPRRRSRDVSENCFENNQ